jgi:hypothetical protein
MIIQPAANARHAWLINTTVHLRVKAVSAITLMAELYFVLTM